MESGNLILTRSSFYRIQDFTWSSRLLKHCRRQRYGGWNFDAFNFRGHRINLRYADRTLSLKKGFFEASGPRLLNVQTLRQFPKDKLKGEVVLLRFDSNLLPGTVNYNNESAWMGISTIKYLYDLGAKVLLVSDWDNSAESTISSKAMADHLSSILQLNVTPTNFSVGFSQIDAKGPDEEGILLLENLAGFKQENANCLDFAKRLSTGIGIYVNDAFSVSHKVLASTVGVTRFCYASLAGFRFEQELSCIMEVAETTRQPYFAIIGGSSFPYKSKALLHLASKCDGLVFVGRMAHHIMHVLKVSGSANLAGNSAVSAIVNLVHLSEARKIPIYLPVDFLCMNCQQPEHLHVFPSDQLPAGWIPVDFGPSTINEMFLKLSTCKKILWIGPVEFTDLKKTNSGESQLAAMLEKLSRSGCDVVVVGSSACNAIAKFRRSSSSYKQFFRASPIWDFLKGKSLPGLAALDKAYPYVLQWNDVFADQTRPLFVDIGSGNGLFLLKMAERWKCLNFLGLDINKKLVHRCLDYVACHEMQNLHFLSANATHTFRSIIASYPGELFFVSVQCPNPDFNNAENRWRMVQRALVEAIEDLLVDGGKVFLQSDVEEVAKRLKDEFIMYSKSLTIDSFYGDGWIKENPFGIRSDWERHVLDRGGLMYRIMLQKKGNYEKNMSEILQLVCGVQTKH